jgi:hypothetical protein
MMLAPLTSTEAKPELLVIEEPLSIFKLPAVSLWLTRLNGVLMRVKPPVKL